MSLTNCIYHVVPAAAFVFGHPRTQPRERRWSYMANAAYRRDKDAVKSIENSFTASANTHLEPLHGTRQGTAAAGEVADHVLGMAIH